MNEQIKQMFGFNPTLVRLRQSLALRSWVGSGMFQSHAGSIEALSDLCLSAGFEEFQSHAGSIEA